jgi:hypothetical protein
LKKAQTALNIEKDPVKGEKLVAEINKDQIAIYVLEGKMTTLDANKAIVNLACMNKAGRNPASAFKECGISEGEMNKRLGEMGVSEGEKLSFTEVEIEPGSPLSEKLSSVKAQ